jgi:hypothetical protein
LHAPLSVGARRGMFRTLSKTRAVGSEDGEWMSLLTDGLRSALDRCAQHRFELSSTNIPEDKRPLTYY